MRFLSRLLLGSGKLAAKTKETLRAEGIVLLEEGLRASLRYYHFRAPGRYHHGKYVPTRVGLGISARRVVVYGSSGRLKLIDSEWTNPNLSMLDVLLEGDGGDELVFRVDYDRGDQPNVRGQIVIRVHTPSAGRAAGELHRRLRR